jgi:DNA repair protein RecO (recombination protein O)
MHITLQPGYILHQRPYRDTSALLELWTRDHGRVGAVARGVRTARSRWRGLLQPFRPLLLSWSGRGELVTLTGAECEASAALLGGRAVLSGFYLNELLLRLLPRHDPHPVLFDRYGGTLEDLRRAASYERALRLFERSLLEELGYGLALDCDAETGDAIVPERLYRYELERGPVAVPSGVHSALVVRGATLLGLARGELEEEGVLQEAKRLMRAALALYLGDRPLRSRELFSVPRQD